MLRERRPPEPGFTTPLETLLERGREGGEIRTDVLWGAKTRFARAKAVICRQDANFGTPQGAARESAARGVRKLCQAARFGGFAAGSSK